MRAEMKEEMRGNESGDGGKMGVVARYTVYHSFGQEIYVCKAYGRESESEMPWIPVHIVIIGTVDGAFVYTRSLDGNLQVKRHAFPSIYDL